MSALAVLLAACGAFALTPSRRGILRLQARPRRSIRLWVTSQWRRRRRRQPFPVGELAAIMAARLRAGASVAEATRAGLSDLGRSGYEVIEEAPEIEAACELATRVGAPLAEVLDGLVDGVDEAREAANARRLAFVGPTMTARLLALLPLGGLALGALVGAQPLHVLTDGGIGTLVGVAGVGAEAVGVWWMRRLIAKAEVDQT